MTLRPIDDDVLFDIYSNKALLPDMHTRVLAVGFIHLAHNNLSAFITYLQVVWTYARNSIIP